LAGLLGIFHVPLNGALGVRLQSALVATFTFYGVAFLAIALLTWLFAPRGAFRPLLDTPVWYFVLPELISVSVVGANTFLIPRLGAINLLVITVAAQLIGRVAISHFGWLESPVDPLNWQKLAGGLLVVGGAFLVVRHTCASERAPGGMSTSALDS
jgi:transporter family-2 protein